ncbi:hypothetical protein Dred_2167 [Desulforamulus reducens MI-1]|uniref:Uncharacterized protein n=1 Tax=Desulforamulus reducens (strain ATCC BAA-1160 / DSM 100696 / MI-1) TaxID=349161 RepID=A4J6I1_DESRM|nr:hypothetical protein [Desulforamulus reducens]ABO50684.1 hypothetical protein Dred_2167 [Desulforamulus reducens MI-1]
MTKRFISQRGILISMDIEIMKDFISEVLDQIDACQSPPYYNPNLDKLGHEVLRAAFEYGLVNLDGSCPNPGKPHDNHSKDNKSQGTGKVIPFRNPQRP